MGKMEAGEIGMTSLGARLIVQGRRKKVSGRTRIYSRLIWIAAVAEQEHAGRWFLAGGGCWSLVVEAVPEEVHRMQREL